jgi:hypothetical protein
MLVKIGSPVIILAALTSDHKHLGITFSEEVKWNKHVENLIKSVSKHIGVLPNLWAFFC